MEFQNLKTELKDGTLTVTVNREKKLNALNLDTVREIGKAFDRAAEDDEVRGVILTGAGQKAFVAGADISEIAELSQADAQRFASNGQKIFAKIEQCPKPVIAAVNGFALGGGCELAMACHLRVASDNAKMGLPEVRLGIIPGYGGTQRLSMLVGRGRALELMMSAQMVNANTAERYGLVNHVVSQEELIGKAQSILDKIYANGPIAISKAIESVNALYEPKADGYEAEAKAFGEACNTDDFKEGTAAFLEKRKPNFQGR